MTVHPTEPAPKVRRRILWRLFLGFCVFSLIALGTLGWYVTTDSFQRWVRQRLIASAEKLSGGRVELGELHTIPLRLRVDARNLTIHGREAADQAPFLHVDRVQAELKITSLFSATVGLHSLELDRPVVHLIAYPDGTTNAPVPPSSRATGQGPIEQLMSLAVSRINVQRGQLLWEDQNIPLEFSARDVGVRLNYSLLRGQYEAHVSAANIGTRIEDYPAFTWDADASFLLLRGRAEFSKLNLKSGKSQLTFTGRLTDFHNPQVSGDYHGTVDLAQFAAITRQPHLRRGTAQLDGKGSWNLRNFSLQGTLQAREVEWADGNLSARNGRMSAKFAVTSDRFHLSDIKANLLGGDLAGDVDIANWQSPTVTTASRRRPIGRVAAGSPPRGSVRLTVSGFPVSPPLAALSSRQLPLDRLNLAGNASGNVELAWVGNIEDAEARGNLTVSAPQKLAAGEVPLHGKIEGVYRGSRDELELSQAQFATPSSEISASGTLSPNSSMRLAVTSHDLREIAPLLQAPSGNELPYHVHGWASFNGTATGRLSQPSANGNLEVYDLQTTIPATARTPRQSLHWDALSAAVQISPHHLSARNGSAIHGKSLLHFDGSAFLDDQGIQRDAPFTLHLDAHNVDLSEVGSMSGLAQPLTGTMDLTATLSGTPATPHGDGHLELQNASIYNVSVPTLQSDLRLADGEILFNGIKTSAYGAELSGSLSVTTTDPNHNNFHLNLSGRNLALARLPRFQSSRFSADGTADFNVSASGTFDQPSVDAHIHIKDLAFDKERAGDFYIDAVTQGRQLDLKAHSDFDKSGITVAGNITLEHDFPADLRLAFHHLDVDSLLRVYLPGKVTSHSPLDGSLQVRGPLRHPRDLKALAELDRVDAELEHVRLQNAEPIRFEISDQVLRIESFHLNGSGTDFVAHGQAHLAGDQTLDLRLDGTVNMALLQSLNPKVLARGDVRLNLTAAGTLSQPVLQGRLEVKNTFISHNDFPSGLSDLNGTLLFDRNRIQIDKLTGTTGGGTVTLTGSATYQEGSLLLDLGATARDVRLRYPPGVSSTANADLRLTGSSNAALLSGDVVVTKLAVTPGFDFGAYVEKSKQAVVLTDSDSLESRLKLDVHVVTTPELQMQTAIARLSGNADLRVRGTADRPVILGRAEVLEGEISFNGTKYKLERGDVTFSNPARTQPVIDMTATTRVRDYDITVQFRGDASVTNGLKVTWQSEPQLPEADVIALLALGRTREESAAANSGGGLGLGGEASNLLINEALNSTVNSRLQRLFGASRVKIDPQGLASETSVVRGPQVTIEQQVAHNLTLTYSTNVSVSTQQIIQVEYNVSRNISIIALRDQNGVVSFDFRIRRRKR